MRPLLWLVVVMLTAATAQAQQPCTTDARFVVNTIYQQVLERPADAAAASAAERLATGQVTVRDLVRELAASPEQRERFLNGTSAPARRGAVTYLYKHVLGREPDPSGLSSYTEGLASAGVDAVVASLVSSAEYDKKYGDNTVPGPSGLQFCGPSSTSSAGRAVPRTALRFSGMDANSDGVITRDEWRGSPRSFEVHDWNRDGVLSGDERSPERRRRTAPGDVDFNAASPDEFDAWSDAGFDNLDHNRDGRITADEWHFDSETFYRADRNRDGALTPWEFAESAADDDRGDRFVDLDVDRNGRVDRQEWHGSDDAYRWLDRDRDGVLSRNEVVGTTGTTVTDRFGALDTNRDGRLTLNEWHWSRRSFQRLDANGDNALDRGEFAASTQPGR